MATWTSYDEVGKAEDVSDIITNIDPTDVPFQTSIKSESIHNVQHQWQEDSLAAAADNKQVEGADAPTEAATATTMRSNYTQILANRIKVSMTADRVKLYGRKSEIAYQLAKKGKEIKRDLEYAFVGIGVNAAVAGNSSTAREMASYVSLVGSNTTNTNAGTPRAFSETITLDVMKKIYNEGGEASILMIKPADASIVADFGQVADKRIRDLGQSKTVVHAVSVYMSPWGEVKVVMNRFLSLTHALFYSPEYWRKLVLRPWNRVKLAVTGDNESHMLIGEYSLKHKNFDASGFANDLS